MSAAVRQRATLHLARSTQLTHSVRLTRTGLILPLPVIAAVSMTANREVAAVIKHHKALFSIAPDDNLHSAQHV